MSPVATPPGTTLSTPSPTERTNPVDESNQGNTQNATTMSRGRPIYLIVATSLNPSMGIGNKGQLPWPSLKPDMSFFKKVTTTPPTLQLAPTTSSLNHPTPNIRNAVIMGRNTWSSIPPHHRPLKNRINVILTRGDVETVAGSILDEIDAHQIASTGSRSGLVMKRHLRGDAASEGRPSKNALILAVYNNVIVTHGISAALKVLYQGYSEPDEMRKNVQLGKVFVIGGAEVYKTTMEMPRDVAVGEVRILQTQVRRKDGRRMECDTFFPIDPATEGEGKEWKQVGGGVLEGWLDGVKTPNGQDEWADAGEEMEVRVCGWERMK